MSETNNATTAAAITEALQAHLLNKTAGRKVVTKIVCADGFSTSVQASASHYCSPRDDEGPWRSVEVGYPSAIAVALLPYADGDGAPTDNVYGYVPVRIVVQVIADHGGLRGEAA